MDRGKQIFFRVVGFLGRDLLFTISLLAAILTSLFHRPNPAAIDWKVIVCLFGLMVVVKGLEACGVLAFLSASLIKRCRSQRGVLLAVCLLSFFSAMALTNDVAIMTLLPILFAMGKASGMDLLFPAIMIAVSANLGSAATPFGNPQNLFLYSYYQMDVGIFFSISLPFVFIALPMLLITICLRKTMPLEVHTEHILLSDGKSIFAYGAAAVLTILSVLDVLPYLSVLPVVILVALRFQRHVLRLVDYRLLLTFIFLFVAIDNLSAFPVLRESITRLTGTPQGVYLSAALLSQIISNVPCAVLLAPFTEYGHALFLGVNVGGLGTLIASMANLIAYKLYRAEHPTEGKRFLVQFSIYNVIFLAIMGGVILFQIR